jgi:hypothetical protein
MQIGVEKTSRPIGEKEQIRLQCASFKTGRIKDRLL